MQLTLVIGEYFRFINLISLFTIIYKMFFYWTHVKLFSNLIKNQFKNRKKAYQKTFDTLAIQVKSSIF